MDLTRSKTEALAMLKTGAPVEEVSRDLNLPTTLVQEWFDSAEEEIISDSALEVRVRDKAVMMLQAGAVGTPKEELENKLSHVAYQILKQMTPTVVLDDECMTSLKKAADAVAVLQRSFFPATTNTTINNLNAVQEGQSRLESWRKDLKD